MAAHNMTDIEGMNQGVAILGKVTDAQKKILSPEATAFLALLHRTFNSTRKNLLQRREIRQQELDKGVLPDFLPETQHVRDNKTWRGAPPAPGPGDCTYAVAACAGAGGSTDRDHRTDGSQDGGKRAQLERVDVHGRF